MQHFKYHILLNIIIIYWNHHFLAGYYGIIRRNMALCVDVKEIIIKTPQKCSKSSNKQFLSSAEVIYNPFIQWWPFSLLWAFPLLTNFNSWKVQVWCHKKIPLKRSFHYFAVHYYEVLLYTSLFMGYWPFRRDYFAL